VTFNIEGFKRNKFYLTSSIKKYNPLVLFLQEDWLAYHETDSLKHEFTAYNFHSTASDMFSDPEDLLFASGCAWHGVTIGWSLEVDKYVTKLPTISDRFCGISFRNGHTNALFYSLYLPTSGKDEEFLEVLTKLSSDITKHRTAHESINIGADTNQSIKSSHRRTDAMKDFQNEIDLHSISKSDEATFHHKKPNF